MDKILKPVSNIELLKKMKLNDDSIFIDGRTPKNVRGSFQNACKKLNAKITTRAEGGGTRIWRVQ